MRYSLSALLLSLLAVTAAACTDEGLGESPLRNVEDEVTLGALTTSSLDRPSGYSVPDGMTVNTDRSSSFDFIYDELPDGRKVVMPLAAIGMEIMGGSNPGILRTTDTFESIMSAPSRGYGIRDTVALQVGDVFVVRSRVACYLSVPQYGKFKVLGFDATAHTVRLQALVNISCGYRNLQPGYPAD